MVVAGRYDLITKIDGSPVFRQQTPCVDNQKNDLELWMWRHDRLDKADMRGWYITRQFGANYWESCDWNENVFAWCPSRSGEPQIFPNVLHHKSAIKQEEPCIEIISTIQFYENSIDTMSKRANQMKKVMWVLMNRAADKDWSDWEDVWAAAQSTFAPAAGSSVQ